MSVFIYDPLTDDKSGGSIPSGGEPGQVLTKTETGVEWMDASSGVVTFNDRDGEVKPKSGDYTAQMVGARPNTWTPTASDVGAISNTSVKSFSYGTSAPTTLANGAVYFVYE